MPRPLTERIDWPNSAGLTAIVLWSLFPLVSRFVHDVPPLQISAMGFAMAGCAGLVLLAWQRRLHELKQKPIAWLHGVGGIFSFNALLFMAMALAPATQAIAINYSWPLFTVLLSALILRIRLRPSHCVGLALGFIGCSVLALKGEQHGFAMRYLPGYACALASSICWAVYSALSAKLGQVPSGALTGFFLATAALSALMGFGFPPSPMAWVWPDPYSMLAIMLLGFGPMGMAYFLWDYGVKHGNPVLLGALSYLCPTLSYVFLALGGYAPIGLVPFAAAVLVMIGGAIAARA